MGRLTKTIPFCLAMLVTYYANTAMSARNFNVPQGALNQQSNWQEPHVPAPELLLEASSSIPIQNFCLNEDSIESTEEMTVCKSWVGEECIEFADEILEIPLNNDKEFCSHWTVTDSDGNEQDFASDYFEALDYHLYRENATEPPFCLPEDLGRVVDFEGLSNSNGRPALFEVQFEGREEQSYQILTCEFVESTATLSNEVILTGGEHSGGGKRKNDQ